MTSPSAGSTPGDGSKTPQRSSEEFSIHMEEGAHFISLLESSLKVGTGIPEAGEIGVVTPTVDAVRNYLGSANLSVWQTFVRNKDIRKNLTIAMAVKLQVLDPSILIKGYLLVKPEDKLGKLAKRAKKLRKKITKTAFKMMGDDDSSGDDEDDEGEEITRLEHELDPKGQGAQRITDHQAKLLNELTYGREEAAELIKKKKEAKKKGERFLDMTLKASLKSVKAASTKLTDATLLASKMTLDVTKESMNVMEKAAERTMERSKEMARLAAESGQAAARGDVMGMTKGMTGMTIGQLNHLMQDAKDMTQASLAQAKAYSDAAQLSMVDALEHQLSMNDTTQTRDHGTVDPKDEKEYFNDENKFWERKFFAIIEIGNHFSMACWPTQPPSMLEHDTGFPPFWCVPMNKLLVEPLKMAGTKLQFTVLRNNADPVERIWPQCFTLKFVSLSERENWLNMYESALAIPLSIFLGMHSLRPLNPVTRLLEMHEALERFEYSRQDPKEHELNTGLKFKISVTMEEFNLDALASALMHLMPIHTYTSAASLGIYSPIMDRMMDVVLKYKMADKACIRNITYLAACYFRQAGEKVASHMLHLATARFTTEHAGGLRLKPLVEALVYFAGIMTERGEDETALMLLKDLDFRLTMLRNLYPDDDTLLVMRGHVRYDIAMKLKRQSDYTHLETLLVGCAQDYETALGAHARELEGPLSQLSEVMATSERHHHAFKLIARVQGLMDRHHTGSLVEKSQQIMLIATRADALAWAGRLDRAHPTLNEAMDMAVEHFGVTHHLVASILLKKGTLTFQSGSVVDAMCYYEEAAEVYEELEYNDLGTLDGPIKRLGGIYMILGRNDMALALMEWYMVMVVAERGAKAKEVGEMTLLLRMLQKACGIGLGGFRGREDPAFIHAQTQPVLDFADMDGKPMTVDDLCEGANRRYNRGEFDEALRLQERVVYELRSHLGGGHPLVAQEVKFLGAIYQKEEMYADALACYEEAAGMFSRVLGPHHPQTAQALNYQGVCECAMMKFEQSAATMERVVELYKRNLHKEHPTLSSAQRLAGHCNLKAGNIDMAYSFLDAYTSAQPAQKTLSLNSGLAAANSYYLMAQILTKRYNFTAATNCATIAHKIQVTELGNQHVVSRKTGAYLKQLSFLHSWATSTIAMQQVLFRIDKTPPMLFGGKSAKDLYVGMPDRTSGKERGSANKKELRKVNEDSRQKSSEQLEAEAEEEQERADNEVLHAKRAAMFSRAQTKAFNLREGGSTEAERDGDDNETVLAQIASFLRQMPAETMNQPESRKPIDDLVAKVKTLASMIHIDTGRPLHRGFYQSVTLLKKAGKKLAELDDQAVLFDRRTDEEIEAERQEREDEKKLKSAGPSLDLAHLGLGGLNVGASAMMGGAASMMGGMGSVGKGGATSMMDMSKGGFKGASSLMGGASSLVGSLRSSGRSSAGQSDGSDPAVPKKLGGWAKARAAGKAASSGSSSPTMADVATEVVEETAKKKRSSSIMSMGAMAFKKALSTTKTKEKDAGGAADEVLDDGSMVGGAQSALGAAN